MKIGIEGSCVDGNYLWFSLDQVNGLCKMNLDTYEIEYVSMIPGEKAQMKFLFSDIKKYRDYLVLTPMNAKAVIIYNTKTEEFKRIPLTTNFIRNEVKYEGWSGFFSSVILGDYIYMIPYKFPAILSINLITFRCDYYDSFMNDIIQEYDENKEFFREDIAVVDTEDSAYAVSLQYGGIFQIDHRRSNMRFLWKTQACENLGFSCIQRINDKFVLLQMYQKKIVLFDNSWNEIETIKYTVRSAAGNFWDFVGSIRHESFIYYIPYQALEIMRFNVLTEEIDFPIQFNTEPYYVRFWKYNNKLFCYGLFKIECVDLDSMERQIIKLKTPSDLLGPVVESSIENGDVINESEGIDLNNLLAFLK